MPRETVEFGPREAIREAIAHGIGVGIFIASECGCDARLTDRPLAPRGGRFGLTEYVVCKQDRLLMVGKQCLQSRLRRTPAGSHSVGG